MLSYDRHNEIINILKENKSATVDYFCQKLFSSEATIRRDLKELEKSGQIIRVRGGAAIIESGNKDEPYLVRSNINKDKKDLICNMALQFIKDGSTIFLDSSSTVNLLANKLNMYSNLTVVTNSLASVLALSNNSKINIISTGGLFINQTTFTGVDCIEFIKKYYFDQSIISCSGISKSFYATEANQENANIKKQIIKNSKNNILLSDSTKFGAQFFCNVCELEEFDFIITDKVDDYYLKSKAEFVVSK